MKKLLVTLLVLFSFVAQADELVLVKLSTPNQQKTLIESPSINVHYFNNQFIIGTIPTSETINFPFKVLAENAWQTDNSYYVVYVHSDSRSDYLSRVKNQVKILHTDENFIVVEANEKEYGPLIPAKNDGMVRLFNTSAKLPKTNSIYQTTIAVDPFVESLLEEVSADNITTTVQHLEDYGTRNTFHANSVLAEDWLAEQFENLGLEVERQSFNAGYYGPSLAKNVIAVKTGTKYPEEYVITGGHFDSVNWYDGDEAPGADDNASGVAGVLEMARILSEHEFDRTIIFCAFAGEEYGLYGSMAYAQRCAQQGMNIVGYFNLDMISYLAPGTEIRTTLIYPSSATELADFYVDICNTYLPDFIIERASSLPGGDSDHTPFNQNGYMGIYPFEDMDNYSPYIHRSTDYVGLSYNHQEQAKIFTQASLASIATMANPLKAPQNLAATAGDSFVSLTWDELADIEGYNIYRDGTVIGTSQTSSYTDYCVINETIYEYYVTALYDGGLTESDPSNLVTAIPMPALSLPLFIDFELGSPYWTLEGDWCVTDLQSYSSSHSLTDNPGNTYQNNTEASAILETINLAGSNIEAASFSFYTIYNIETNVDYVYVEVSKDNEATWDELDALTGSQMNWLQKTYSLDPYLGESEVTIRFRMKTDETIVRNGIYIDDFRINLNIIGCAEYETATSIYPNPVTDVLTIELPTQNRIQLTLTDSKGAVLKTETAQTKAQLDLSDLPSGTYFLNYVINETRVTKKIIKN
ncbi:MAG: M20/M25/M40 family metallo-hydrolase [Lentimicrobiaceae bacterium]|jgi:hypothetical protein|nr:M20/M25/M40 family metallo-hydrolase [Lentimicrobiaceae bacterium]